MAALILNARNRRIKPYSLDAVFHGKLLPLVVGLRRAIQLRVWDRIAVSKLFFTWLAFASSKGCALPKNALKRVLLVNPNTCDNPYPVFPLGIAYVDAALKRAGVETRVVDLNLDGIEGVFRALKEYDPDWIALSLRNIDDVRISVREFFVNAIRDFIENLRSLSSAPVILGGSGFSVMPKEIYGYCRPDFGIAGEGEEALVNLIEGQCPASIAGLVYMDASGEIRANPVRAYSGFKTDVPFRDPRLFAHYLTDGGMANLQTQRGCPLHCCYCTYPVIEGRSYRKRDGKSIADEFESLKAMGARYVFIVDSVFNTSEAHVRGICEELVARGSPLPWGCFMRPKHLTRELVGLLKASGLKHVEFGSDSLCDAVLKSYRKDFTFEDIRRSSELMLDAGIDFCHFIIFGGPGETAETLSESFENSRQIHHGLFFPSIGMRVYPRTSLHRVSVSEGGSSDESELLKPSYYIAPGLTEAGLMGRISEFAHQSANWVDLEHSPAFDEISRRLRRKGVVGPLWNYLSVLRRLS